MLPHVYLIGTADTKSAELTYLRSVLSKRGIQTLIVDVSTSMTSAPSDISAQTVAAYHPAGATAVFCDNRGQAIAAMSEALARFLPGLTTRKCVLRTLRVNA